MIISKHYSVLSPMPCFTIWALHECPRYIRERINMRGDVWFFATMGM